MEIPVHIIKESLCACPAEKLPERLSALGGDERKSVRELLLRYEKKYNAYLAELARLKALSVFEEKYFAQGVTLVGGTDEAGRGPLAGPVAAAVAVLPRGVVIEGIDDSKKLTPKKREELFIEIKEKASDFSVAMVSPGEIDEINILQATYEAMRRALSGLRDAPGALLVDALTIPGIRIRQEGIIKGDSKSVSIAAASILAKVTRDAYMTEAAEIYPEYGFHKHKGYGSPEHIAAIRKYGPCPIHRKSFVKNFI